MIDRADNVFYFDEFVVDADRRLLLRKGEAVHLKGKAFDVLVMLIENRGAVVSKNQILDTVWENQFVEENNLTVHITALRKALGETRNDHRYIVTVPGKGYRFVGALTEPSKEEEVVVQRRTLEKIVIDEEFEEDDSAEPGVRALVAAKRGSRVWIAAALLMVAGGLIGIVGWTQFQAGSSAPFEAASVRRLTNHGRASVAVISPDGKTFAYSQTENGSPRTEIRLGLTTGKSDTSLIPVGDDLLYPTAFSADSQSLYYVATAPRAQGAGTLFKIPVLGGVPTKLISGVNSIPSISPDETQIAFVRGDSDEGETTIVVASLDGSNERALLSRGKADYIRGYSLSWSPDSKLIAFAAGSDKGQGYSSAAGENSKAEIFTVDVTSSETAQVTRLEWNEVAKIDWLKDGSGLLAIARDKDSFAAAQIWHIDYPSGAARNIAKDLSHYGSALSLSRDSKIGVAAQVNRESSVWIGASDDLAKANQVSEGGLFRQDGWYGLGWLGPDRVVFSARVDHSLALWVMNRDGSDRRQITPPDAQDRTPTASPDGALIVFESNRSGRGDIWRVRPDGTDLVQLTKDGGNSDPSVSPDGNWVVYRHSAEGEESLRKIAMGGGAPVPLLAGTCRSPRLSNDGKFVSCGYTLEGKQKLAVVSFEEGKPVKFFEVPRSFNFEMGAIRWSADDRFIDYRDWYNGVWRQPIDGGEAKRIEGLPDEKLLQFAWSPDGKYAAFTRGRAIRDVVMIEDK